MTNPRKAAPALYELIGNQTRVKSGLQIGGRNRSDDEADEAVAAEAAGAHHHHPPAAPTPRAPGPAPAATPLHIARPPVPAPPPPAEPKPRLTHAEPTEDQDPAPPPVPLGPGRAVRVPTGYMLFGFAAVLATAIGGYMFGYVQKEREYNEVAREEAQKTGAHLTEPVDEGPLPRLATKPQQNPGTGGSKPAGNAVPPRPQPQPSVGPGVTIIEKGIPDPREKGKNYAVVASLGKDRAVEVANFLAKNGVDTAVLPRDTLGLYPVVSLTGFAKDEFRGDTRRQHENRLRDLGKQFAQQGGGRKDFSDLWWIRFDG